MCAYSNNLFAKPGERKRWTKMTFYSLWLAPLLSPLNIEFCANITLFFHFFSLSFLGMGEGRRRNYCCGSGGREKGEKEDGGKSYWASANILIVWQIQGRPKKCYF